MFNKSILIIILSIISIILLTKSSNNLSKLDSINILGDSMYPTYSDGDLVKYSSEITTVRNNDIVIFKLENDDILIKRVIGVEGDLVEIKNNSIYLNKELMIEYKEDNNNNNFFIHELIVKVPKDKLFVLGDNYNNSYDSRNFGCISIESIKGIVK